MRRRPGDLFQSKGHILKIGKCFKAIYFHMHAEKNISSIEKHHGGRPLEISKPKKVKKSDHLILPEEK
jgi:hypothetical protein